MENLKQDLIRRYLFWFVLFFIIVLAFLVVRLGDKVSGYHKGSSTVLDTAIFQAQILFREQESRGIDMSSGPCLSNDLMRGWVADVVHNPRQPIDDLSENRCDAYLNGRSTHFVELDTDGNFVRAK